jgi:hypothetical protein
MTIIIQVQAHLQFARPVPPLREANAQVKNHKRASTTPTQKRISIFFSNALKNKNATHSRDSMTTKLNTDNGLQGQ